MCAREALSVQCALHLVSGPPLMPEEIETLWPDSENSSFAQRSLCDKLDYFADGERSNGKILAAKIPDFLITQPKSQNICKFYSLGAAM